MKKFVFGALLLILGLLVLAACTADNGTDLPVNQPATQYTETSASDTSMDKQLYDIGAGQTTTAEEIDPAEETDSVQLDDSQNLELPVGTPIDIGDGPIPPEGIKDISYIILDGNFLGTYEDGQWNSYLDSWPEENSILSVVNAVNKRKIALDELNGLNINSFNDGQYIGDGICGLIVGDYDDTYQTDIKMADENAEKEVKLSISGSYNPLPNEPPIEVTPTEVHAEAVRQVLDQYGYTNTEVYISQVISCDLDNNDTREDIVLAQTPDNSNGCPDLAPEDRFDNGCGVYTLGLIIKDGQVIPFFLRAFILSQMVYHEDLVDIGLPFGVDACMDIQFVGVFDLNGDGVSEICVDEWYWEGSEMIAFSLNSNNVFSEVLCGDYYLM